MPPTTQRRRARSAAVRGSPTASASAGSVTASAERAAIRRVTRPSASVTRSRVRGGSRLPASTPTADPTSTVATLTAVPVPTITGLLGQLGGL